MTPLIHSLQVELEALLRHQWPSYTVPGLWVGSCDPVTFPSPPAYFLHQLRVIDRDRKVLRQRTWNPEKVLAYGGMVRHITSYNHGQGVGTHGWRTTGTFLKLAGLLPYLTRLGVDTLILQPVTDIGRVARKGTLGSPYAVQNPWRLDPYLAEPAVSYSVENQARVFIELCHSLGIKVILEVVLRTASIDSSLVSSNPEWFYWINEAEAGDAAQFTPPSFTAKDVKAIRHKVEKKQFYNLPEPSAEYREQFSAPPLKVEFDERGWKGLGSRNTVLRIPPGFADWPPDDNQPLWTDVTYLRLHDHPHFRYMAYNTLRMFDSELDSEHYRISPLWNTLASLIPFYIRSFNIDGAMIDMGHALPADLRRKIVADARLLKDSFTLYWEQFDAEGVSAAEGYDAVVGHLPVTAHSASEIGKHIVAVAEQQNSVPVFASPESHNTMRAAVRLGSARAAIAVWTLLRALPRSIGFIHAGMELGEVIPVNTGLGFTSEEIAQYSYNTLPMFSDVPLAWDDSADTVNAMVTASRRLTASAFWANATQSDKVFPLSVTDTLLGFLRLPHGSRQGMICLANLSEEPIVTKISIPADCGLMFVSPHTGIKHVGGRLDVELPATTCEMVFTLHG